MLLFVEAVEALLHQLGIIFDVEAVLAISRGMLGMLEGLHVKTLALLRRNSVRADSMFGDMPTPM